MDTDGVDLAEVLAFVDACDADSLQIEHSEDDQGLLEGAAAVPGVFLRPPEVPEVLGNPQNTPKTVVNQHNVSWKEGQKKRPTAKRRRPADYNPNRAREEQRKELGALRDQVQILEQTLTLLHSTKSEVPGTNNRKKAGDGDASGREKEKQVWKELAVRQIELHAAAESEHKRLQSEVQVQKRIIAELQHLIACKATEKAMELARIASTAPRSMVYSFDPSVFTSMLEQVEKRYHDIDRVFQTDTELWGESSNELRLGNMREDASGHLYFQFFGSKVFPFDVTRVADAAWERFSYSVRPNESDFFFQYFDAPDNAIAEVFGTELQVDNKKAVVSASQVKRIYREKDRIAIVWQTNSSAVRFLERELLGATYQENGYFLIERPPLAPEGFALLRTCYVLTPTVPTRSLAEGSLELALVQFVSEWMAATIPANHKILEDILVLESVGASRIPAPQELARTLAHRSLLAARRLCASAAK